MIVCFLPGAWPSWAEEFRLESMGVRGGFDADLATSGLYQAQVFGNWTLPWAWDLGKEWRLQSRLDLSAGWLSDNQVDAAIGTVGPTLVLRRRRLPVSLEAGPSPTLLSRHHFREEDVGTNFQISSHVGLNWDFAEHWRLSYRFEHISNGGLASPNPGLRMHIFGLSFVF